ncbi:MAG: hypothetical protein Q7V88_15465 [Actinomycetota bacterium]|nr:hypothetical protein [Actinomycetota bacterium]
MSAIDDKAAEWAAAGWDLGAAHTDELALPDGRNHRRYENGWLLDDPNVGVWLVWGPALARLHADGGPEQRGFPTWAAGNEAGDAWWWAFEDHSMYVQTTSELWLLTDTLGAAWVVRGGTAVFGLPAADASAVAGGWAVHFATTASIYQPPVPANWLLHGRLNLEYWNQGGPAGSLGWPTADVVDQGDAVGTQAATFEHGQLQTTTTGEVTVTPLGGSAPTGGDRRSRAVALVQSFVPSDTGDAAFGEIAKDYTGGGTTCGFLCHWLLWRLGVRERGFVNREEAADGLNYVDGQNMTRLFHRGVAPFVTVLGTRKMADGLRPQAGDCVYVKTDVSPENAKSGAGEHVFVFLSATTDDSGREIWHSADAGQRNAANEQCARFVDRALTVHGTTAQLSFAGELRHVIGWVDLDLLDLPTP